MLEHARAFHNFGFSLHLLRSKSKIPIESKWSTSPRKSWIEIRKAYKPGLNIGVVLGTKSKLSDDTFLGVIDCDVKGIGEKYERELEAKLKELIKVPAPVVISGRGNGSRHIYFKSKKPITPTSYFKSKEKVKVFMPSVKSSGSDRLALTNDEIEKGYRSRPAWEISIMGDGQQVVLPPSIHPDSKKPYKWSKPVRGVAEFPLLDLSHLYKDKTSEPLLIKTDMGFISVDVATLPIDDKFKKMITDGDGVDDRSAALYSVALHALHHDVSEKVILNVLTNPKYYLGQTAYDHAKTKNRKVAAKWVYNHTLKKALAEINCSALFDDEVEMVKLDEAGIKKQAKEMGCDKDSIGDWRDGLSRNQLDGAPKPNYKNIKSIIHNSCNTNDRGVASRNLFKHEDTWTCKTPWGAKKGETIIDDHILAIKDYLSEKFRMDAPRDKVSEVVSVLALKNSFHPVKNYLEKIKWDGTERLATWLKDYLRAVGDPEILECFGVRTLIGMIRRIYEPGCKFDTVLILQGDQGVGKSTAARILASDDFFSDTEISIGNKDAMIAIQGSWVVELGELSFMSKKDTETTKQFISSATDKFRPPYGRRDVKYPRQCIFIGTTNRDKPFKDETGNRRYWPVKIGKVRFEKLKRDRDQLLAEAKELYFMGMPSYISSDEVELEAKVKAVQESRMRYDELANAVGELLDNESTSNLDDDNDEIDMDKFDNKKFSLRELFEALNFPSLRFDQATVERLADICRKKKYVLIRSSKSGKKGNFWAPEISYFKGTK